MSVEDFELLRPLAQFTARHPVVTAEDAVEGRIPKLSLLSDLLGRCGSIPGSVSPSCAFVGSARAYQLEVSVRAMKSISSCVNLYAGEASEPRLVANAPCDMERVELDAGRGLGLPSVAADARLLLNQPCQQFWSKYGGAGRLWG